MLCSIPHACMLHLISVCLHHSCSPLCFNDQHLLDIHMTAQCLLTLCTLYWANIMQAASDHNRLFYSAKIFCFRHILGPMLQHFSTTAFIGILRSDHQVTHSHDQLDGLSMIVEPCSVTSYCLIIFLPFSFRIGITHPFIKPCVKSK